MLQLKNTLFPLTFITALASASPTLKLHTRQGFRSLSQQEINQYDPYTNYAAAAYCPISQINDWDCGGNCDANSGFTVSASGGDGSSVPQWYVGYDPNLKTVVIAHEGSDEATAENMANTNDNLVQLDKTFFPQTATKKNVLVHQGFQDLHSKTASAILQATKDALNANQNTNSVTAVGHGPGAALALLDMLLIQNNLYAGVKYYYTGYSLPRVGNGEFASVIGNLTHVLFNHINNKEDPNPTLPGNVDDSVKPNTDDSAKPNTDDSVKPSTDNGSANTDNDSTEPSNGSPQPLAEIESTTNNLDLSSIDNLGFANNLNQLIKRADPDSSSDNGFVQPTGEIHIQDNGDWVMCPGQDNDDPRCSKGDLEVSTPNPNDYYGPYNGIFIQC